MADPKRSGNGKNSASNSNKNKRAYVGNVRDARNARKAAGASSQDGRSSAGGSARNPKGTQGGTAGSRNPEGAGGRTPSKTGNAAGSRTSSKAGNTAGSRSSSKAGNTAGSRSSSKAGSTANGRNSSRAAGTVPGRSSSKAGNTAGSRKAASAGSTREKKSSSALKYEEYLKMRPDKDDNIRDEIGLVITALLCVLMVLSYLKLCGSFGSIVNNVIFGLFGSFGYAFPFVLFTVVLFAISNKRNVSIVSKVIYCFLIMVDISAMVQLFGGGFDASIGFTDYFSHSQIGYLGPGRTYGGLLGGGLCKILCPFLGNVGAGTVMVAGLLILLILILGKAILTAITLKSAEGISHLRQRNRERREEKEELARAWEEYELEFARSREEDQEDFGPEEEELEDLDEYFFDNDERFDADPAFTGTGRRRPDSASRRKKKKEAGRSFIDSLMRRGMGLDISRIEETPEYKELKESYGMSDYEMGELISDAIREKQEHDSAAAGEKQHDVNAAVSGNTQNGQISAAEFGNEPVDLVKAELDKKFGDTGSVQVVNLRGHSKVTKETAPNYFIDEDPDDPGYPDTTELNEELKKQVASFYDDDNAGMPEAGGFDLSGNSSNEKVYSSGKNAGREVSETKNIENDAAEVKNAEKDAAASKNADRDASGAVGFNSPEQIKAEMERAEELRRNPPYEFPPIDLLKKSDKAKGADPGELKEMVGKLQSTLESFGVHVRVGDATCGPTVTRYEIYPEQGVKVKNITALADDIKLALAVPDIRIESPIPGKAAVGIEVPNKTTTPVSLRELIDSDEFRNMQSKLTCAIGKDIGGKIICSDIGSMPHALVAGSTGSGKSVCINSMILSILYKAKPSEVRLILIDPKRVELVGYNGIPHLLVPVVTDVKKATAALNWAVAEMDDRYNRFADAGVNNLASYNRLMEEKYYDEGGTEEECPDRLPQILIIIDEFCDLMMTGNPKEVEQSVGRLTQLARAAGIHLVIATQRPAVNVITGTIKANIPTRISFSLTSLVDSRTILDQAGAEKLLGKGDMLFSPQGISNPVRLQGAYVSDKEIAAVVSFIKEQCKQNMYNEAVSRHIESNAAGDSKNQGQAEQGQSAGDPQNDRDEYFAEAGRLIIKNKKASIGAIQRAYRVGFNRAARIMDQLAEDGVVGPEEGTKPRRILMTMEQFEAYLSGETTVGTTDAGDEENPGADDAES